MFGTFFKALIALLFIGMVTAPVAWADDDDDDGGAVVTDDDDDDGDDDDDDGDDSDEFSEDLREDVTLRAVRRHQRRLQRIADRNNGTRAAGTSGYDQSVDYVVRRLERAGYEVTRQPFTFPFFEEFGPPTLEQISPIPTVYPADDPAGFNSMTYSGNGDATAPLEAVDVAGGDSGCEAADFAGFGAGNIALVRRGTCSFQLKADNADAAGAVGLIVFNDGANENRVDAINGRLGGPSVLFPVVGASEALGQELVALLAVGPVTVRLATDVLSENRPTENVIADTRSGNPNQTIVVGAHLDSVLAGPGINDNGSGSAGILEVAIQLADYDEGDDDDDDDGEIRNRVRFAWWGAEELGLLGSNFYVANATQEELDEIALNLNFDMIGSPNFVRFIYDGDGSDTVDPDTGLPVIGPPGSEHIEQMFINHFVEQGLPVEPTLFSGRSDYGPFIAPGIDIPAGGLFTGAEDEKTQELADVYGGTVDAQFDPCYHEACDTFENNSNEVLDQNVDAVAHGVAFYASRDDLFAPIPALVPVSVLTGSISMGDDHHDHGHDAVTE